MLEEEFKMWPINPLPNAILVIVHIYVTNLSYLKNGPLYITELLDNSTEESNMIVLGLDTAVVILETNN